MVRIAPRISPRLLTELERLDDGKRSIADITRTVGGLAERLGLTRPSYEQVRTLVHLNRARPWVPTTREVIVDIALRSRPPEALNDHLAGIDLPKIRTRPHRPK
jgi:hypothetical protein